MGITKCPSRSPLPNILCCSVLKRRCHQHNPSSNQSYEGGSKRGARYVAHDRNWFRAQVGIIEQKKLRRWHPSLNRLPIPSRQRSWNQDQRWSSCYFSRRHRQKNWLRPFMIDSRNWRLSMIVLSVNYIASVIVNDLTIRNASSVYSGHTLNRWSNWMETIRSPLQKWRTRTTRRL